MTVTDEFVRSPDHFTDRLYPIRLRNEIDAVNDEVFRDVNNGVYRAGFAINQEMYERVVRRLFDRLDALSKRLKHQRYLIGDTITEADVRLFVALVRFDPPPDEAVPPPLTRSLVRFLESPDA